MKFLKNLFGKKQNDGTNCDLAFYEKLIDLIVVSPTLQETLQINLKKAFEDPKSFYDDHNEFILSERGLTYPSDLSQTPKFVLIDLLEENGEMTEIDWKERESEIRLYLNQIRVAKKYNFSLVDDDLYTGFKTDKILRLIDEKELSPQGYSIAELDIGSDSHPLTIVPLEIVKEVKLMFQEL